METNNETQNVIIKALVYILGVSIGLASKLALINRQRDLKMREVISHTAVAFASAWIVWNGLDYYHVNGNICQAAAVIVGRFGDAILMAIWELVKKWVNSDSKDILK